MAPKLKLAFVLAVPLSSKVVLGDEGPNKWLNSGGQNDVAAFSWSTS
jgi:hypothetical protein